MPGVLSESVSLLGIVYFVSAIIMQPTLFLVPTFLMASRFPRRDQFTRRCVVAWLLMVAFNIAITVAIWAGQEGGPLFAARYAVNAAAYVLYLVALVPAVLHCFEMGFWDALFCATAGYTIQNIGSGLGEFLRLLFKATTGSALAQIPTVHLSDLSVIAMITVYYLVFIKHLGNLGGLGRDSRLMLETAVGVILVVIAFDVVVRGLEREGAELGFLLVLRIIHGAVSFFVLFAEYEMLYNVRLRSEVVAQERLAAEREHQYELSRETISAVNRRVHDIRHKVVRDLAASDAQVSREVLAEVARDIAVYDTQVKTGNDVIDTILTEKSLLCARRGVTLSCIADGTALAGIPAADLYALFGSLLDDAIEQVCDLPNERKRSISLTLRRVGSLALLHVERYGAEANQAALASAREIVERHGGTLTTSHRDVLAAHDVMLPVS